jgi:predicted O-methyltransferase YrrM
VADLIADNQAIKFIDIGSGLGDLCMQVASLKPYALVVGIEIAPIPWLISKLRAHFKRVDVRFQLGNYRSLNFADYDLVFAYLSPAVMPQLWQQAQAKMRPHSLLVSYEFTIPNVAPTRVIRRDDESPAMYVYAIPA